jgi:hypothetical protein
MKAGDTVVVRNMNDWMDGIKAKVIRVYGGSGRGRGGAVVEIELLQATPKGKYKPGDSLSVYKHQLKKE